MTDVPTVVAVAVGGALGATGRYGVNEVAPHEPGSFGWIVLAVNVLGCLLLGVLVGLVDTAGVRHRLARPFLGAGVLGGFTTFSAFALDAHQLAVAGAAPAALAYVGLTIVGCLTAALVGVRSVLRR